MRTSWRPIERLFWATLVMIEWDTHQGNSRDRGMTQCVAGGVLQTNGSGIRPLSNKNDLGAAIQSLGAILRLYREV